MMMTTETIPLNITRHTYDGTSKTLPPLDHKSRVSAACLVFFGGARQPTRASLVKDEGGLFWMVGADIYPPLPDDIWFYACELDPILTATSTDVSLIGPFAAWLERQWKWSRETFGPGYRTGGVIEHIRKECIEVEETPFVSKEWLDILTLALDGYQRHGGTIESLLPDLQALQDKNFSRQWPNWREVPEGVAIEHDRSAEEKSEGLITEEEWRSTSFVPDKKRKVVVRRAHYGDEIKGNVFWVRENGSVLSELYLKNENGRTFIGDSDQWRYAKEGE